MPHIHAKIGRDSLFLVLLYASLPAVFLLANLLQGYSWSYQILTPSIGWAAILAFFYTIWKAKLSSRKKDATILLFLYIIVPGPIAVGNLRDPVLIITAFTAWAVILTFFYGIYRIIDTLLDQRRKPSGHDSQLGDSSHSTNLPTTRSLPQERPNVSPGQKR